MRTGGNSAEWKVVPVGVSTSVIFRTTELEKVFLGSPSLVAFPNGRLAVSVDLLGPGVKKLQGVKGRLAHVNHWIQGKVFVSADKGKSWKSRLDYPFCNGRLMRDGAVLYLLGHAGNLRISRSSDGGESWGKAEDLNSNDNFYIRPPGNPWLAGGSLLIPAVRTSDPRYRSDDPAAFSLVMLRARQGGDLTDRRNWTVSAPSAPLPEFLGGQRPELSGIPFDREPSYSRASSEPAPFRPGWDAPHILQVSDADHLWHDPTGRTLVVLARAHGVRGNVAILARGVEDESGAIRLEPVRTPAGARWVFLPLPGGSLGFDILYDDVTKVFWLLGNAVTDSMDCRPQQRPGAFGPEAGRLQLYFSRNLVDWNLAGIVLAPGADRVSHFDAVMAVSGKDLCLVSCVRDANTRSAREADAIAFHVVPDFRELVY